MKRNEAVSKIMSKELVTVHLGQKLSEVRALLGEENIHHIPVVSDQKLAGLITSSDILKAGFGSNQGEIDNTLDHTASLEDVMQKTPATIQQDATVRDAAESLSGGDFHCLPVLDGENLVGIVTSTDLIRYLLEQY